jgi:hypothetical protein
MDSGGGNIHVLPKLSGCIAASIRSFQERMKIMLFS